MMKILFAIFSVIFLSGCNSNKIPGSVLSSEKMESVLFEYICADIYAKDYLSSDSTKNLKEETFRLEEIAFKKNNTNRKTFTESYEWYQKHSDKMKVMLDSIGVKKNRELEKERINRYKSLQK
jgi:hypothetical protein